MTKPEPTSDRHDNSLSHGQRQWWTGQQLHPDEPLYNMALAFTIQGPLDAQLFAEAFSYVVANTDSMRTVFVESGAGVNRQVLVDDNFDLPLLDYGEDPRGEDRSRQFLESAARSALDIRSRCFDSALVRLGDSKHIWFLNQHHLISDALSFTLIYERVVTRYLELEQKIPDEAKPEPSYQLLVDHESSEEARAAQETGRKYWAEKVRNQPSGDPIYGAVRTNLSTASTRISRQFGEARVEKLHRLLARPDVPGLTPGLATFNVLAAVLSAWIARITGSSSVGFGFFAHNRTKREFSNIVGTFVEPFPFVSEVEPNASFVSLIEQVAAETLQSLRYVNNGVSQPSYTRDLTVVFNLITARLCSFGDRVVQTEWVHNGHSDVGHAIRIAFHDFDQTGNLCVAFDFNDDAFADTSPSHVVEHFFSLLDACLDDPLSSPTTSRLPGTQEHEALLAIACSDSSVENDDWQPVVRDFEQRARLHPDRIACWADGVSLTYKELDESANELAHRLASIAGCHGGVVAISVPRSLDFVVGVFAAHKAGAAYFPIDPTDPIERRLAQTKRSGAVAVIVHELTAIDALGLSVPLLVPDLAASSATPPHVEHRSTDVAYLVGTSGSTGLPKIIQLEHGNLSGLVSWVHEVFYEPIELSGDRPLKVGLVAPFVFDPTVQQMFATLGLGHCLYLVPEHARLDGGQLLDFISAHELDVSDGTPGHLRLLLDGSTKDIDNLSIHLLIGGDVMPKALARRFLERSNGVTVTNLYGPAECCVYATHWHVEPESLDEFQTVPIGKPLPGSRVYIVDEFDNLQPFGLVGELVIAGSGVGRGYIGDAELTARKFSDDPFVLGERRYKTGDLARMSKSGNIEFVERKDLQVKVQGHRIELLEVESALRSFRSTRHAPPLARADAQGMVNANDDLRSAAIEILDAAVTLVEDASGARQLHAFYVSSHPFPVEELRSGLSRLLPKYMIPARFVRVDQIPLTRNGKVDRAALKVSQDRPELAVAYAAPTTAVEVALVDVWVEILGIEEVGIYDNFFAIGGDSIKVLEVIDLARERGIEISTRHVFTSATIAGLADLAVSIEPGHTTGVDPVRSPPQRDASGRQSPSLSLAEQGLRFEQLLRPDSRMLNVTRVYEVGATIDAEQFEIAVREAVRHHEPLTWTFGEPRRHLRTDEAIAFHRETPRVNRSSADDRIAQFQAMRVNLEEGPLLRCLLQSLTDGKTIVSLHLHHISADQAGLEALWQSIDAAYAGNEIEPPAVGYADLARWQSEMWDASQVFWLDQSFGAALQLDHAGDEEDGYLEAPSSVSATELRGSPNLREFATALTAAAVAVRPLFATDVVDVSLIASTRDHEQARDLVGYMLNPLPLQFDISPDSTFKSLASSVSVSASEALEHRTYPISRIVDDARRAGGTPPLGQVLVSIRDEEAHHLAGALVEHRTLFSGSAVADLTLFLLLHGDHATLGVEFSARVGRGAAEAVLERFDQALLATIQTPNAAIALGGSTA